MPRSRKSKKRDTGSTCESRTHDNSNQRESAPVYVQLTNCQIGSHNIQVQPSSDTKHDTKDGSQRNKDAEIHTGVLILKSILERSQKALLYSELEEELSKYMLSEHLESFRHITGWSLNDFLTLKKDSFEVYKRKQRKYVKYRNKPNKVKSLTTTGCSESTSKDKQDDNETNTSIGDFKTSLDSEDSGGSDTTDETWTVVCGKKKRRTTLISKKTFPVDCNIDGKVIPSNLLYSSVTRKEEKFRNWSADRLQSLIKHGEARDKIFILSPDIYFSNPLKFSIDVVSLWNTPHRMRAYIVIGVSKSGDISGIDLALKEYAMKDLFRISCFSNVPLFDCFKVRWKEKCVCIIEIETSCGKKSPAIVEKTEYTDDIQVAEREVWIRTGKRNTVCNSRELEDVYKWFLSPVSEMELSNTSKQTEAQDHSRRRITKSVENTECLHQLDEEMCASIGNNFDFFWEAVNGFHKGHFVLITGNIACGKDYLCALADVPWICVYDFDIFSYSDGLLNAMQVLLGKNRHLTLSSWNDQPENISERGTRWCFMRGRREMSSTRTDQRNDEIEEPHIWFKTVMKGLQNYCDKLANFAEDYTIPTVVILWPDEEKLVPFMMKFLNRLIDTLTSTPNIVLCMNRPPQAKYAKHKFESLCDDYASQVSVCYVGYEQMCIGITNRLLSKVNDEIAYELPKNAGHVSQVINEADATWLREDLEILFLNNPFDTSNVSNEEIQQEVSNFYKGGTLPWYAWYNAEAEQAVIDRDIKKNLDEKINKHLEGYKTSVITVLHAPGSGGTTLAQKTLWNFHSKVPCAHLKLRAVSSVDELDRKISFLHEKTDLPVLLLIDGEEESNIRCLSKRFKYTVILYIKRYPYKIPAFMSNPCRVYLSGNISATESQTLESKLEQKCGDKRKRKMLRKFTLDIQEHKSYHNMYEYGLTLYLHEFKGVVSYVEGYLQLNKQKELSPSQRCLGFLSLVYYYGQTCVPCQFFSALFNKPHNFNMSLDDFPAPIQEFVVYDKNESKRNNIRICHYIVAKEILEQILSRSIGRSSDLFDTLSSAACRNLSKFCMEFIEYASSKKTKISALSTTIKFVLTKTFIFRDEKDMSDNEEQVRKKPVLSKLMIDIPGGKPLFTDRLNVLKKLTQSFPDDPNYWAHLGRFHAFCRPDEEHEAERCFKKAVKLCEEQIKGKRDEEIDDGMKLTMTHIYHMYGIVKQRYISKYTGLSQKEKVVTFNDDCIFHEHIEELVPIAETACEYFTKSRYMTPDNHDVYTYAYTGEIQVRLQICDYVNRNFKTETTTNTVTAFLYSCADPGAKLFVQRSVSVIENLILECYMDVDLKDSDLKSLRKYVYWYNGLFQKQVLPLENFSSSDGVSDRRLKIAAKKLRYGKANSHQLSGVEMIDNEDDLEEIVHLYEENFSDINDYGFQDGDGKKELERDFRDWIFAIRNEKFKKKYSLEEVLNQVQMWYEKTRSPISVFYLFIIKSLLGFGTENVAGKTECLLEAIECRERLIKMNHLVIRPKYPREWFGSDGVGIKRLKSGNRHVGICAEERDSEHASYRIDLAVCKGTICRPNNNKVNGMIALDLGVNTTEVKIYFIPKKVNLEGCRFAGQRVEFNLAFSIQHGYEAYNVKLLTRHGCSSCSRTIEFTSTESTLFCKCGTYVYRDETNMVK